MPDSRKVIRIRRDLFLTQQQREVVQLAFDYWRASFGLLEGSPEDHFYRARREVMTTRSGARSSMARPFLVPSLVHHGGD